MKDWTGIEEMSRDVLLVTEMEGVENFASALGSMLGCTVEAAGTRRAGLLAVRRREFGVVLVEDSLAERDSEWADQMWAAAGLAMPMRINFAISGVTRLTREVRNALSRRDGEQAMVKRAVAAALENEFRGSVTGLLLQSELALQEAAGFTRLEPKLRNLVELAGELRHRLKGAQA